VKRQRWALSPSDYRAHAVAVEAYRDGLGVMTARCGHDMPTAAGLDDAPRATLCAGCVLMDALALEQPRRGEWM
jgi:hypothetical protein